MHSLAVSAQGANASQSATVLDWIILFISFVLILTVDLVMMKRTKGELSSRQSLMQTALFISFAGAVGLGILMFSGFGSQGGAQFFAAYATEWSLSLDNLFMIGAVLTYFAVPREYQHKVLYWGIIGQIILRLISVTGGLALVTHITWAMVLLGLWLIKSGIVGLKGEEDEPDVTSNWGYRLVTKFVPITPRFYGDKFIVRAGGKLRVTPLLICLLVSELADFGATGDSGPAGFGITHNTFILFAANIMAVMGLRSVFFMVSYLTDKLRFLGTGVNFILIFIGVKAILANDDQMKVFGYHQVNVPTWLMLSVILGIIAISTLASLVWPQAATEPSEEVANKDEVMVQLYVDAGIVMEGEWQTGMVRHFGGEVLHAINSRDTDGDIPVFAYGESIVPLGVDPIDEVDLTHRPNVGQESNLAAALLHAEKTATPASGKYVFVFMTPGDLKDDDARRAVRQAFLTLPDNAFVVFVRVSDAPGGAEFLRELDDYNVKDADRVHTIQATDDNGDPLENIREHIGDELDAWLATAVPAMS